MTARPNKVYRDARQNIYPESARPALELVPDLTAVQRENAAMSDEIGRLGQTEAGRFLDVRGIQLQYERINEAIRRAKPYRVCPTCGGVDPEACKSCSTAHLPGAGWVNEERYNGGA